MSSVTAIDNQAALLDHVIKPIELLMRIVAAGCDGHRVTAVIQLVPVTLTDTCNGYGVLVADPNVGNAGNLFAKLQHRPR